MMVGPLVDEDYSSTTLVHYPHPVMQKQGSRFQANLWCKEQYGPGGARLVTKDSGVEQHIDTDRVWSRIPGGLYCFKDERHAFEFKMRWG